MKELKKMQRLLTCLVLCVFVVSAQGCTYFDNVDGENTAPLKPESQQFHPKDFKEVVIPEGLELDREESMYAKSSNFNGGILNYQGRLEITSLTEFFENTMPQNGWKLSGSVKAAQSLLIFTKPNKTCMITIKDSKLGVNTEVFIYISEQHHGDDL